MGIMDTTQKVSDQVLLERLSADYQIGMGSISQNSEPASSSWESASTAQAPIKDMVSAKDRLIMSDAASGIWNSASFGISPCENLQSETRSVCAVQIVAIFIN